MRLSIIIGTDIDLDMIEERYLCPAFGRKRELNEWNL